MIFTVALIAAFTVYTSHGGVISNPVNCVNQNSNCDAWANGKECQVNPVYMIVSCPHSCNVCYYGDKNWQCGYWARRGECQKNPAYMNSKCSTSCEPEPRMTGCIKACKEKACASEESLTEGCNQMFSCPHACKMRDLGLSVSACKTKCQRKSNSGCQVTVNDHVFSLCTSCSREGCAEHFPTVEECIIGCDYY